MSIKSRLDRLGGRVKRCPLCNYPGPLSKNIQIEVVATTLEIDPETGRPLPPPEPEPQYCPECGIEFPQIDVKGMYDKAMGGRMHNA
jgi:hypothetical protein